MLHMAATPAFSANAGIVGLAYDFTPSGTTFSPSATVRFGYDPALIPPGIAENNLQISYYDVAAKVWVALPSTVDIGAHVVYAQIAHFTPYAVTYGVTNPTPVLTTSTTPVVTSSTATTATTASLIIIPITTTSTTSLTTTVATPESQTKATTSAGILNIDQPSTTDASIQPDAPKVVKLNLLAITIGVDAILIIIVVAVILLIRRNMIKNRQVK
jgi:hypothetical protein